MPDTFPPTPAGLALNTIAAGRADSAAARNHADRVARRIDMVQKASRRGDVLIEGIIGIQKEAVLAAKRSLVTVEEIVDDFGPRSANAMILPSWTVTAVACVPGGAHPSYAHGYYTRDNAYYKAWDAISRERDSFLAWMKTNVLEQGPEVFAAHARRLQAAAE